MLLLLLRQVGDSFREDLALDELFHREEVVGEDLGEDGEEVVVVLVQVDGEEGDFGEDGTQVQRELVLDLEFLCGASSVSNETLGGEDLSGPLATSAFNMSS